MIRKGTNGSVMVAWGVYVFGYEWGFDFFQIGFMQSALGRAGVIREENCRIIPKDNLSDMAEKFHVETHI
jgi:hypothetical protein